MVPKARERGHSTPQHMSGSTHPPVGGVCQLTNRDSMQDMNSKSHCASIALGGRPNEAVATKAAQ